MTDEPFDVEALRAKIAAEMHRTEYVGERHQLSWVLSLLPDPPPKYEVVKNHTNHAWWQVVPTKAIGIAAEFSTNHYPDAEQRAREECARLNETQK